MTDMHENSLAAYKSLNLTERQSEVLKIFTLYNWARLTDRQVAKSLKWEVHRVDPRIGELTDMGVLEECDRIIGPYGRLVRVSRIRPKETLF
jgi:hypothetical protein